MATKNVWILALFIPFLTAVGGAMFWSWAQATHTMGQLQHGPLGLVHAAIMFGGIGAGWFFLMLQPFPNQAIKWMLMAIYPFAMLALAIAIDIDMNGVGIEGF